LKVTRAANLRPPTCTCCIGLFPTRALAATFGHEFTGEVEEVGPSVRSLKKGDRVVVPFNISCGTCFYCSRGLTASLREYQSQFGYRAAGFRIFDTTGGYEGAQ